MREILRASKLSKRFAKPEKVEILKEVNFVLSRGESVAIMGASGEGKSTLLHILGTLEAPTAGNLEIVGEQFEPTKAPALRSRHIGFVFQSFNLLEEYTALNNILMPALIAKQNVRKGSHAYERAYTLLEQVGLKERAHFPSKLLSGGEKQRVAIARALMNDPEILLADEPSGNLDAKHSGAIHDILLSCSSSLNKGVVVVTHDPSLAKLCDRTLILKEGALINETA